MTTSRKVIGFPTRISPAVIVTALDSRDYSGSHSFATFGWVYIALQLNIGLCLLNSLLEPDFQVTIRVWLAQSQGASRVTRPFAEFLNGVEKTVLPRISRADHPVIGLQLRTDTVTLFLGSVDTDLTGKRYTSKRRRICLPHHST